MKRAASLILPWLFLVACHREVDTPIEISQLPKMLEQDVVVVLETKQHLVVAPFKSFLADLEQWVREHPNIPEDNELLRAVQRAAPTQASPRGFRLVRADSVVKARSLTHRLVYRISDLLRADKCLFYNKQRRRVDSTYQEYQVSSPMGYDGHGFIVSKDTLLEVVDKIY